jgi:hypothetical protein
VGAYWLDGTPSGARALVASGATAQSIGKNVFGLSSGSSDTEPTVEARSDADEQQRAQGAQRDGARTQDPQSADEVAAQVGGFDTAADTVPGATELANDDGPRDITREEEAVLDMYETIATVFEQQGDDCHELGIAVSEFVSDDRDALAQFAQTRAAMTDEQRQKATERLEREAAPQLSRLRQSIRVGLGKCPTEQRLQEAIRDIASAGTS